MGRLLAAHDLEIVYGAGITGSMGTRTLADGAIQAGGKVIGVIPEGVERWMTRETWQNFFKYLLLSSCRRSFSSS